MDEMNDLERLLYHLPSDPPPQDLAGRVLRNVQARRRRRMGIQLGFGLILAAGGTWLSAPLVPAFTPSGGFPASALAILLEWLQATLAGAEPHFTYTWNGLAGLQSGIAAPVDVSAALGLAALTLSILLILGQVLPRAGEQTREGVS